MTKPLIIFDLGKVLVDFDYSIAAQKSAARSQKPPGDLHSFLSTSPHLMDFESGRMTRRQFFDAIQRAIGFHGDLAEFGTYFADIFTEMPDTIALHAELRRAGYQTFILSNTNDLAVEHVRRRFSFFSNFDGYILSYEVGGLKPEPEIYAAMEKLTGRSGADLIYIDDRPENIETGLARGWRAVVHESAEKTRRALKGWGVV
jgi:FMN phosphatase YigB (HAD superfamily)